MIIRRFDQGADKTSITSGDIETEEKDATAPEHDKTPRASDDEGKEDKTDGKETAGEEKKVSIGTYFTFVMVIINSTLTSMTKYMNRFSRDYRYIRKVLTKEKKVLKVRDETRKNLITPRLVFSFELLLERLTCRQSQISEWVCDWVSIKCGNRYL